MTTPPPTAPRPMLQLGIGCLFIPLSVLLGLAGTFFYSRAQASASFVVPDKAVLLVRTRPDPTAPLLARLGAGRPVRATGRSNDWRWLEIKLSQGRSGWALRPLDILVWQLEAAPTTGRLPATLPVAVTPVAETMISIPATTFTRGSPPGLGEADEHPAHPVQLAAFAIDRTEVTVGQFWACVMAGVCVPPASDASQTIPHYVQDPAFDNHPMINVSWAEANTYCKWRGKRLPTEAEWELAAGWELGQSAKRLWVWGNGPQPAPVNAGDSAASDTVVVGSSAGDVSAMGVRDLAGNVSEWVSDWYKVDYYSVADPTNPLGPTYRRGEGSGRVIRGAAFTDPVTETRPANRRQRAEGYGYPTVGFRCAKTEP